MPGRVVGVLAALALVLAPTTAGCGDEPARTEPEMPGVSACQQQWHDVGESVLGLDQDTVPSALASRWTSVIATVDYYATSTSAKDCATNIENESRAISALRRFSDKLRPFDMTYQRDRVAAGVDLYLHQPVPGKVHDGDGHPVKPPTHHAVEQAWATLTAQADRADTELQPGWGQLATVSLDDDGAVRSALDDLDTLAQSGPSWQACEQALQVIATALKAQESAG